LLYKEENRRKDAMKYKIDLHVHSKFSGDNDADPEDVVSRAISIGLHGIAFTEHSYYGASEPVERLKKKYESRIRIFRGVEFSAAEGHCLIFGVDTDKFSVKYAPMNDIITIVGKSGGVVIPSHPYRPGTGIGDLVRSIPGISALEGCNGCNMYAFNVQAIGAARALNIPYTGGSDAHSSQDVGSCFTEFSEDVTYENFIGLLKSGKYLGVDTRKISRVSSPILFR
jgi:predicted metal-dependent phosphoesterase TrpH